MLVPAEMPNLLEVGYWIRLSPKTYCFCRYPSTFVFVLIRSVGTLLARRWSRWRRWLWGGWLWWRDGSVGERWSDRWRTRRLLLVVRVFLESGDALLHPLRELVRLLVEGAFGRQRGNTALWRRRRSRSNSTGLSDRLLLAMLQRRSLTRCRRGLFRLGTESGIFVVLVLLLVFLLLLFVWTLLRHDLGRRRRATVVVSKHCEYVRDPHCCSRCR